MRSAVEVFTFVVFTSRTRTYNLCVSGGHRMVIDHFQQRLLDKIDQEIAEAERLVRLQSQLSAADGHARASSERLQQSLIVMRERRRSVRRQFLAQEQSFTDSLVLGSSMQQGQKELPDQQGSTTGS